MAAQHAALMRWLPCTSNDTSPRVSVTPGEPQISVTESEGKRYIKSTGIFSGLELHLFLEPSLYDDR